VYDTGAHANHSSLTVFWHQGTPNISAPPEPLFPISAELGIRWVSYDDLDTVDQPRTQAAAGDPGFTDADKAHLRGRRPGSSTSYVP
jgi:hypothetical protein